MFVACGNNENKDQKPADQNQTENAANLENNDNAGAADLNATAADDAQKDIKTNAEQKGTKVANKAVDKTAEVGEKVLDKAGDKAIEEVGKQLDQKPRR